MSTINPLSHLASYGDSDSDSESDSGSPSQPTHNVEIPALPTTAVNSAPAVAALQSKRYVDPASGDLRHNPLYEQMAIAVQGPQHPFLAPLGKQERIEPGFAGKYDEFGITEAMFNVNHDSFRSQGFGSDPGDGKIIKKWAHDERKGVVVPRKDNDESEGQASAASKKGKGKGKRRRVDRDWDPESNEFSGPWAPYEEELPELSVEDREELARQRAEAASRKADKERERAERLEEREVEMGKKPATVGPTTERTMLHIKEDELTDYQGRSIFDPPSDLKLVDWELDTNSCAAPRGQRLSKWTAHSGAVCSVRYQPTHGHLLLSGGMHTSDCKVKLWDVRNPKKIRLLRSYHGHTKGIRDIRFTSHKPYGSKFASVSFDKFLKIWDVESGECVARMSNGKQIIRAVPHPDSDEENCNVILVASHDRRIYQWDIRSPEKPVQEYDRHLASVNSIVFYDNNTKFVSSSDDKSLRVWEYPLPVETKVIREDWMHSIPAMAKSPDDKFLLAQSMDNKIYCYNLDADRVYLNKKKMFHGHLVSGQACEPCFSPDGRYVMSGDANGSVHVWDFAPRRRQNRKTIKAHPGSVVITAIWHPIKRHEFAAASWDGSISIWE